MNLAFLKIDRIIENQGHKIIEIPAGGIQFECRGNMIQSIDPVQLEMNHMGIFHNTMRYMNFAVYTDQSLFASGQLMYESVFSVVAHEEVQQAIYKEIAKRCKVVPMYKPVNERELFAREYEAAYELLMGV
ncbi:molecular chaperone [Solibacillus sp. FSL K6-1781]|uniref:molecular chaperone n=1 Tax=Solibacillus sp. FSL K6-1781 TaxID=2921474 RepID=UPI00315ABBA3